MKTDIERAAAKHAAVLDRARPVQQFEALEKASRLSTELDA